MIARRFAVIGDPIGHSRSPSMHRAAYAAAGLPHAYDALHVPHERLGELVERVRRGELDGVNVTVPHKIAVLAHVDALADSATWQGAANTLCREGGRVIAHNTDVPALAAELQALAPERGPRDWREQPALVLGSGGAARAAVAALVHLLGVRSVTVWARSFALASARQAFLQGMDAVCTEGVELTLAPFGAQVEPQGFTSVVQATSLGLPGSDEAAVARLIASIPWARLPASAIALDAVYGAQPTAFVQAAHAHGLRACDGQGMLARQGALAYALWLGGEPPFAVMHAALRST